MKQDLLEELDEDSREALLEIDNNFKELKVVLKNFAEVLSNLDIRLIKCEEDIKDVNNKMFDL